MVILKNSNGFTITEALVSLTIMLIITTVFIPLMSFVSFENKALSHKRLIIHQLHDELQSHLSTDTSAFPVTIHHSTESIDVTYQFQVYEELGVLGCAYWTNKNNRNEEVCLNGLLE